LIRPIAAALLVGLWLLAAPPVRCGQATSAAPVPVVIPPLFVDGLLDSLSVGQAGFRYRAHPAMMEGQRYERSLVTDVEPGRTEGASTLTLLLGASFDVLRATVGREDSESAQGAGGVYCEIWGDDRLLYKSAVLVSRKHPVRIGGLTQGIRSAPEEVEVSLKGVDVLRLVTRYASDVRQQGREAGRARGCVWGDVRLMPRAGAASSLRAFDPVRDALRTAAARVTSAVIDAAPEGSTGAVRAPTPLRVGIMPLHIDGDSTDEVAVRDALRLLLSGARSGAGAVFAPLARRDEGRLAGALLPGGAAEADAALSAAGRQAGADIVVAGSLTAAKDGRLELRAVDVRTGKQMASAAVALVFPAGGKNN